MKKIILILIVISGLFLTGCKKDAQVNDFMKEFDSVASEIAERFDEGEINEARKTLDVEKSSLRAKWVAIRTLQSNQVSENVKKKMNTEPIENMEKVVKSANKAIEKYPNEKTNIQSIVNDLSNIVK